jgi:hypothetical protein
MLYSMMCIKQYSLENLHYSVDLKMKAKLLRF